MPSEELEPDSRSPNAIQLTIPPRLYLLPGAAIIVGTIIGLRRGSRRASMQFLAENVHRPPTTLQGWYFYKKTKNYKMMLSGLQQAGVDAGKLTLTVLGWVGIEEGMERVGWGEFAEIGAGLGTAGLFSAIYRLPLQATRRSMILGLMVGSSMRLLRYGKEIMKANS